MSDLERTIFIADYEPDDLPNYMWLQMENSVFETVLASKVTDRRELEVLLVKTSRMLAAGLESAPSGTRSFRGSSADPLCV